MPSAGCEHAIPATKRRLGSAVTRIYYWIHWTCMKTLCVMTIYLLATESQVADGPTDMAVLTGASDQSDLLMNSRHKNIVQMRCRPSLRSSRNFNWVSNCLVANPMSVLFDAYHGSCAPIIGSLVPMHVRLVFLAQRFHMAPHWNRVHYVPTGAVNRILKWSVYLLCLPVTVTARSKAAWVLRSWVRIPLEVWMIVFVFRVALSYVARGLCDGLITRPNKSYHVS
jgi:hypothetical protein